MKKSASIQASLLVIAGVFITLYAAGLTVSSALQQGAWTGMVDWQHWIGWFVWVVLAIIAHRTIKNNLQTFDPFLLPAAFLLTGWGLLSVYRLFPVFGLRQTTWLAICVAVFLIGTRFSTTLILLRRYKYVWLTAGIFLASLTLVFGLNPSGSAGPKLWLGCCGVYFQPTEPLKLLLIVYLAAFLADRYLYPARLATKRTFSGPFLAIIAPTLIMTGLALLLLGVQKDLGAGFVFIFLYASIVFMASNQWKLLGAAAISLLIATLTGYFLFDVVQIRLAAWINPWLDPSGGSYQIAQAMLAIAKGGISGLGPGSGNPELVPVPHSDFIFTSITEEMGFLGAVALLLVIGIIASRGFVIAFNSTGSFRRYLAAGLTVFLVAQSILIIGGNIRLLPLTGVTLPFVSYGGSSLLVSYISLLFLLQISDTVHQPAAPLPNPKSYLFIYAVLLTGILAAIALVAWWSIFRAPILLN